MKSSGKGRASSQRKLVSELVQTLTELERRASRDRLASYRPYERQREFHDAGLIHRERLFMAGNQLGKTWAGGFECAMHLTGRYPGWWNGRRYDRPVRMWAAGVTGIRSLGNTEWEIRLRENADSQSSAQAILEKCFSSGIVLRRFDQSEPSLHDAFVALVGAENLKGEAA